MGRIDDGNSFDKACEVEKLAMAILIPFMSRCYPKMQLVPTVDHRLIQKFCGDWVANWGKRGEFIELKAEKANLYGNLFLETWSNKSRQTRGWMETCWADWLWYYFVESDELYIAKMSPLKTWLEQHASRFPEKQQSKYTQKNDTWGRCVPISVLSADVPTFTGPFSTQRIETA